MSQMLEGIDIYECPFFKVESDGKLKFAKGKFYDKSPEEFNTVKEIRELTAYCLWIIEQKDSLDVTRYASLVFLNRVNKKLEKIEREFRKLVKKKRVSQEASLKSSINKPGKTYL